MLAVMASGIGMQLFELASKGSRYAGLPSLHSTIENSAPAFLAAAAVAWLVAEVNLLKIALSAGPVTSTSDSRWFSVFAPIIVFLYASIALALIGAAGLFAAAIAHNVASESAASGIGLVVSIALVCWLVYVAKA